MRTALALLATFAALSLSRAAFADVTITGTVGEIGIMPNLQNGNQTYIRFKLTDLNQTKTCNNQGPAVPTYAWFYGANVSPASGLNDPNYHEWYAALLLSKKGAPISCTIDSNTNCHVTSCTLP